MLYNNSMLVNFRASSAEEKRLLQLYRQLSLADQITLLRFTEFLVNSSTAVDNSESILVFPEPQVIARPAQESVVKAIKRLRATYPMVDPERLLNETSNLMSAHVIQGKAAGLVIDELEKVFQQHYQLLKTEFERKQTIALTVVDT